MGAVKTKRMPEKVQFNVQVPPNIAARIRADARRAGKTLDDVTTAILSDFLAGWTVSERARFYAQSKPKVLGRHLQSQ